MMQAVDVVGGELWVDVDGWPGYRVSNLGRVASLWRLKGKGRARPAIRVLTDAPRLLKLSLARRYYHVTLYRGGEPTCFAVHHLVLLHFVGQRPFPESLGLHRDDDTANNTATNLYWGTEKDNAADRVRNGHARGAGKGSAHHKALLDEEGVIEIRRRLAAGGTDTAIGRDMGVTRKAITRIRKGEGWRHVRTDDAIPVKLPSATRSRLVAAQGRRKDNRSGYKGVSAKGAGWMARVTKDGKTVCLGTFATAADAARAVNEAYQEYYPGLPSPNEISRESTA